MIDPRVRREAETLAENGYVVDVICLRQPGELKKETVNKVNIIRLPVKRHRQRGIIVYLIEYLTFLFLAWFFLRKKRYDLIQVHTPPDFLVLAAYLGKNRQTKLLIDMHELTPELLAAKYNLPAESTIIKIAKFVEKMSVNLADHVIVANQLYQSRLTRSIEGKKIIPIINSADERIFKQPLARKVKSNGSFKLIYHGTLAERYGVDLALKAVYKLQNLIPEISLVIYGEGPQQAYLKQLAQNLKIHKRVFFKGCVDISKIPALLVEADLGLVPLRKNSHTELAFPTKLFEYVALGIPAVVAKTKAVEQVFSERAVAYFTPGDAASLAEKIATIYFQREQVEDMVKRAFIEYSQAYSWNLVKKQYVELIAKYC